MAEEVATPDVPESSPETVDTISATPETTPNGSEAVTNTEESNTTQGVPLPRFQEVNNTLKQTREELQALQAKFEEANKAPEPQGEKLDPEAERMLKAAGFMTKAEIEAQQTALRGEMQLHNDLAELKSLHKDFDPDKVLPFALENMGAKSKEALEAAYFYQNKDKMLEEARNQAIASANGVGVAERPGAGEPKQPEGPELKGTSKEMLTQALQAQRSGGK